MAPPHSFGCGILYNQLAKEQEMKLLEMYGNLGEGSGSNIPPARPKHRRDERGARPRNGKGVIVELESGVGRQHRGGVSPVYKHPRAPE